jgi:alpha-amylase
LGVQDNGLRFATWKKKQSTKVLDNNSFLPLLKSIITWWRTSFDFGIKNKLFQNGFNNMINFEFKWDAQRL